MELPDWAQRALEKRRPRGVGHADPDPDPDRFAWWEACVSRFEARWEFLDIDNWKIPFAHDCYARLWRDVTWAPSDFVRLCILETAIDLAWDRSIGNKPSQVAESVKELERVNAEIAEAAAHLSGLFQQRTGLWLDYGVEDYAPDHRTADPFDLWDALEMAMGDESVASWANVAKDEIAKFLQIARSQSRTKPRWPLLLEQVASRIDREVAPGDAGDVAVMASRTNSTEWSQWGRRLLGTLDDWPGTFPRGFLRSCLTYPQLAALAEVALDAPPQAFNAEQIRKLTKSYEASKK